MFGVDTQLLNELAAQIVKEEQSKPVQYTEEEIIARAERAMEVRGILRKAILKYLQDQHSDPVRKP